MFCLSVYLLVLAIGIILIIRSIWRDWPNFKNSWAAMSNFEQYCLIVGFIAYLGLPLLSSHPAAPSYIGQVGIKVFEAIANGLFLVGVLAFVKNLHAASKVAK